MCSRSLRAASSSPSRRSGSISRSVCGGLVSFGHAAFIGIGAYAAGILTASGIEDGFIGLFVALAASAFFALATGAVSLKTRGVHFIMITLAFGQMAYFVANSLKAYGGDDGLSIAARSTIGGWPLLKSDRTFYYFTLICLLATYLFCRALVGSRFGRGSDHASEVLRNVRSHGHPPLPSGAGP